MIVPPGSTIGIVGGGQLGRMLAMAAARLGYRCHVFAPDAGSVAAEVAAAFTCGDYHRPELMRGFAEGCAVVTYEFENVPVGALRLIGDKVPVRPGLRALEVSQDRVEEKTFIRALGGRTAPFAVAHDGESLAAALGEVGAPAILKTVRMGYDGKGQARIDRVEDGPAALRALGGGPAIVEGLVRFEREYSVLLARGLDGAIVYWDACENRHDGGMLASTRLPAHADILAQQPEARALAAKAAEALDYVGVMAVEYFATADGPMFNEMAPRVHNSGHWTIEGAQTSQFENHVRAICGLPLGPAGRTAPRVEMRNLVGPEAESWPAVLAEPGAHLHLYGKGEPRAGRKMGHVTRLIGRDGD